MNITDEMLASVDEIIIEARRVTMVMKFKREFIFTNGWNESNQIGSAINRQMVRVKTQNKKDEK